MKRKQLLLLCSGVFAAFLAVAQTTVESNQSNTPTDYLGWDAATTFPLNIRHNGNQNINILRNGLNRMQFQTENWTGLNATI